MTKTSFHISFTAWQGPGFLEKLARAPAGAVASRFSVRFEVWAACDAEHITSASTRVPVVVRTFYLGCWGVDVRRELQGTAELG